VTQRYRRGSKATRGTVSGPGASRHERGDMIDTVIKLLPALLGITAGYVLQLRGVAEHRDADFVFRLVINVFLPALAFTALSRVSIGRDLAVFPLAAVVIITLGYLTGRLLASKGPFLAPQQAVAICCCMNVNSGFILRSCRASTAPTASPGSLRSTP